MSKTFKYVILGLVGIAALVILVPFFGGMLSSLNPNNALQMADQKKAENKEIYVPSGYTVLKKAEAQDSDYGTLYISKMSNQNYTIQIIQSNKSTKTCRGKTMTLASQNICYYNIGEIQGQPNNKVLMWDKGNNSYQLETNDSTLSDIELEKIVGSL